MAQNGISHVIERTDNFVNCPPVGLCLDNLDSLRRVGYISRVRIMYNFESYSI